MKPSRAANLPRTSGPTAAATFNGVSVRMYRLGVGDCFLVRFPRDGQPPLSMLIDCGVHQSQAGGALRVRDAVLDIQRETGGRLDIIVATHEHWDHLSGFLQAEDLFRTFSVGELWVAWTENAADPVAKGLIKTRHQAIAAVSIAEARLRLAGRHGDGNRLTGILGFFGDTSGERLRKAGSALRSFVPASGIIYREPGEPPIDLPGCSARAFVLGPPRDARAIGRSAPTKQGDEVYRFGGYAAALDAMQPALGGRVAVPFDGRFALSLDGTSGVPFFDHRYWSPNAPGQDLERLLEDVSEVDSARGYRVDTTQRWRRIDQDWLDGATSLALKLDEDTNNTSLVLAIELGQPGTGPVLLFAADAQVGNWLSWHSVAWKGHGGRDVDASDLLRRTVLYKVGHHASHNATLREKGLELMDSLQIALIPTDAAMAKKVGWGTLPWKSLLDRLDEKTGSRVVRTDVNIRSKAGISLKADSLFYEIGV